MGKIISDNKTLKELFKFFKKRNDSNNMKVDITLRMLEYCKGAYNPVVEDPLVTDNSR